MTKRVDLMLDLGELVIQIDENGDIEIDVSGAGECYYFTREEAVELANAILAVAKQS